MYYSELKTIIEKIVKGDIEKDTLIEYLTNNFDCEKIYDSGEKMVTDAFFTLKHYASGEEDVFLEEWLYFLDCLEGRCKYNMKKKISISAKRS